MKSKVAFGYLHPGQIENCFHESVIELMFYDASLHGRLLHSHGKMGKRAGAAAIADGRNLLTKIMLDESEADWLLMIDSDMGFAPDTVERLIDSAHAIDRPIVGALCFAYRNDGKASFFGTRFRACPTLYDWVDQGDDVGFLSRFDYEPDALQPVAATGAACIIVHRLALEAIRERYGDTWFEQVTHPNGRRFSEDMSFCFRAASLDIPMFVDTRIKTTHCKGAIYYDEEYFLAQEWVRRMAQEKDPVDAS